MSNRFKRIMPEILNVPMFTGVRIHGGNTKEDTLGCPLLGAKQSLDKVWDCADVNKQLITLLDGAIKAGKKCFLEIIE